MTDLRAALEEAIADSYIDTHNAGLALVDDYAEAALDAVLDTLADRADEWITTAGGHPENGIDRRATAALIAVLRGDE